MSLRALRRRLSDLRMDLTYGPLQTEMPGMPVFAIGLYAGSSPVELQPAAGIANPVLSPEHVTDAEALLVADPFMVRAGGEWHMFFEVLNRRTQRGEIGYAVSRDARQWRYRQIVLRESFHLSYPYVFQWEGDWYLVPETCAVQAVRLYRAASFPLAWVPAGTLLAGLDVVDASPFRHREGWWMFVGEGRAPFRADRTRLFQAERLLGPWREHPRSPVVRGNPRRGRPGGRVVTMGDRLLRYVQDCHPWYGMRVHALEILELSDRAYRERPAARAAVLQGREAGWNAGGMHHVDAHQEPDGRWIACVDGWRFESSPAASSAALAVGAPGAA